MDIISLTEKKLNLSKHEVLKYLSNLAGESTVKTQNIASQSQLQNPNYTKDFEQQRSTFLKNPTAKKYAESFSPLRVE